MPVAQQSRKLAQTPPVALGAKSAGQALITVGVAAAVLTLALQCWQYLLLGAYFDHIEGNVVLGGWQYAHGEPLYAFEDGAPRLASYYGPLAYLFPLPAMLFLGANVAASKCASLLALCATAVSMGCYFLRNAAGEEWRDGLLYLLGGLLIFMPVSCWARPDPIETLVTAAAVISARSAWRPLWVGICIGLAVNLKAHAGLYLVPVVVDLCSTRSWRVLPVIAIAAAVTFVAPFLAPGISPQGYVVGLVQQVGRRAQSAQQLPSILFTAALLMLPVTIPFALRPQPRRTKIYAAATGITMALLFYPATFPGAGAYHLLPMLPVLADLRWRLRPQGIDAALSPFLILLIGLLNTGQTSQLLAVKRADWNVAEEALALARESSPRSVQVGYGDNRRSYEQSQLSKTVLALNSYPAVIDAQILMELRQIGIDGSARWLPILEECRIERWLIPKGEAPFAATSYFYDGMPLFGGDFRNAFFANYRPVKETAHFVVWDCAASGDGCSHCAATLAPLSARQTSPR